MGRTLAKKGKKEGTVKLTQVNMERPLPEDKKKDVKNLLSKHYGQNWRDNPTLSWYVKVLDGETVDAEHNDNDGQVICDCLEDDCGLHI